METGFRGTFVISWSQTEIDGQKAATMDALTVGASWRWSGEAVRVDGPRNLLKLDGALGTSELRKRAAQSVRRLVGVAMTPSQKSEELDPEGRLQDNGFVVSDGRRTYAVTMIETGAGGFPLLMFFDQLPPEDTDLWLVHRHQQDRFLNRMTDQAGSVICFTAGTRLRSETGQCPVEELCEGDLLQTKDDGLQPILWIGNRRMSGARLFAMPDNRPIRIRSGSLCEGEPDQDLLVSPDHRLLLRGATSRVLFNTSEVLVAAKHLVNNRDILVDHQVREVTYYHVLLANHQVVWANGVECESFHPASMSLDDMEASQRNRLVQVLPESVSDPHTYGDFARRNLSSSEAAILLHEAA